jgi:hypothetical protein
MAKHVANRAWRVTRCGLLLLVPLVVCFLPLLSAQQVFRENFEREPAWIKGTADVEFRENVHRITEDTAHTGQHSEQIQVEAQPGSFIHYYLDIGRAPVTDELNVSVWVKANRPGVQFLARFVLPQERSPNNPEEPLSVVVRGDAYQLAGRWQRLEMRRPVKLLKDQQQLLRAGLNRDILLADAYVDRVILNVYGGLGLTDVWIDDLEAGPVLETASPKPAGRPTAQQASPETPRRAAVVQHNRDQLLVNGEKFFFRGVRYRPDTPMRVLRDAGFNTIWIDESTDSAVIDEAANLRLWVVPILSSALKDQQLTSNDALTRSLSRFLDRDEVLFFDVGGGLKADLAPAVALTAQRLRAVDSRPLAADVWDGFLFYSSKVQLLGVHRWPLMTGLELTKYRDWLYQRRQLAEPGTFFWTWVQTHTPEWYADVAGDALRVPPEEEVIPTSSPSPRPASRTTTLAGPQPEQIRLLTYTALAAGCRGLGFWTDRFSAEPQDRDRLLTLALLNQELEMLKPLLVNAEAPTWIETSLKEVKAAVMHTDYGGVHHILVLPVWVGPGSQLVPSQAAVVNLKIVVPVPNGAQAWEVLPGEVRSLPSERAVGGTKVIVPEFGLTTAIVFTSDNGPNGLVARFQKQATQQRKLAAQWAHDLAQVELEKVARVNEELEQAGHRLLDGAALVADARTRLNASTVSFNNGLYSNSYREAQAAMRPLRILMRAHWEQAVHDLNAISNPDARPREDYLRNTSSPMASPYAMSFYTLTKHWQLVDQVRQAGPGPNVLPGGDFEAPPADIPFTAQQDTLDDVVMTADRTNERPHNGQRSLRLQIKPKDPKRNPPALERTFLAIHSPAVRLEPGTLVQISGWVRIPEAITASADGALLYDSAGGEPLAVRLTEATEWKKFTLYRRVPADGSIYVTAALTGLGTAYFDDLQIEPLVLGAPRNPASALADAPRRQPPTAVPASRPRNARGR